MSMRKLQLRSCDAFYPRSQMQKMIPDTRYVYFLAATKHSIKKDTLIVLFIFSLPRSSLLSQIHFSDIV